MRNEVVQVARRNLYVVFSSSTAPNNFSYLNVPRFYAIVLANIVYKQAKPLQLQGMFRYTFTYITKEACANALRAACRTGQCRMYSLYVLRTEGASFLF
ncbi:hypothetical protein POVWA2_040950 [Plasmodium ovale wallikeri]|uniref:Uncharacterized protein n=1 Tax=Plasmodium ovale wallikeri TaxID=864142 RepID=A0A1A8ZAX5_PLAOA|nr:hypothetical protein POVWA1_042450 [Plasmodium ovale wallikeri]SBT40987.1 hypothetical protein POVWA2_040950 [Plasmodium ovale wallikeri]